MKKYPHQRYFQVNLVPLHKFGTLEFRAHSATFDPERIMRWTQFLVAFVEHFGKGPGHAKMTRFFMASDAADYKRLQRAQREATAASLFAELAGTVDSGSKAYFSSRIWEEGDKTCEPPAVAPPAQVGTCAPDAEEDWVPATLTSRKGSKRMMQVQIPDDSRQNLPVMMPEGNIWMVRITFANGYGGQKVAKYAEMPDGSKATVDSDNNRFHFTYDLEEEEERRLKESIEQHNRCCCDEADPPNCLWYPEDTLQDSGRCPRLFDSATGDGRCTSGDSALTCWMTTGCHQTHHSRRRSKSSHACRATRDPSSYFQGKRCGKEQR